MGDHLAGYLDDEGVPGPAGSPRGLPSGAGRRPAIAGVARRGITHMAARFIAGTDATAARPTFERIWAAGMGVIVDLLGEKTITRPDADRYAAWRGGRPHRRTPTRANGEAGGPSPSSRPRWLPGCTR